MCRAFFFTNNPLAENIKPQRRFSPFNILFMRNLIEYMKITREYLHTMDFYSALSYWGSCNFTDITEFKPAVLFTKKAEDTNIQKGQGLTPRLCTARQGWKTKQRTTSWAKHFPCLPKALQISCRDIFKCRARMKLTSCIHYLISAKYICLGIALWQFKWNWNVFSFPSRGSVVTDTAIATTCGSVLCSSSESAP